MFLNVLTIINYVLYCNSLSNVRVYLQYAEDDGSVKVKKIRFSALKINRISHNGGS